MHSRCLHRTLTIERGAFGPGMEGIPTNLHQPLLVKTLGGRRKLFPWPSFVVRRSNARNTQIAKDARHVAYRTYPFIDDGTRSPIPIIPNTKQTSPIELRAGGPRTKKIRTSARPLPLVKTLGKRRVLFSWLSFVGRLFHKHHRTYSVPINKSQSATFPLESVI